MGNFAEKLAAKPPAFQRAYLGSLPYTQANSGQWEKYCQTLTDFDFIAAKVQHREFGVQALIEDYDFLEDSEIVDEPGLAPQKVEALKLIQGALRLSAHILDADRTQLVEQLWGRLQGFEIPEIDSLLQGAKQWKTLPWLRPLTASLTPPGGRLIRTLQGHTDSVTAVAVSGDASLAISGSHDQTVRVWDLHTGTERFTLQGHTDSVTAVAVSGDASLAISGSSDQTVRVWDLQGKIVTRFTADSPIWSCAVTPDGKTIVAGDTFGRVHFLRWEGMKP